MDKTQGVLLKIDPVIKPPKDSYNIKCVYKYE